MSEGIRRPPLGYHISLYDDLVRAVRELPAEIERERTLIAACQEALASYERQFADAASTLAWMESHQAHEIAAREASREQVLGALREAGWKV